MKRSGTIVIVAIGLATGAFLTVHRPLSPQLSIIASVAVVGFAAPAYRVIIRNFGWRLGSGLLTLLCVYALLVESSAIATGIPYGHFLYRDALGPKLLGLTPWTVAFAYPPILLGAFAIAWQYIDLGSGWAVSKIVAATAAGTMLADLVLDPAAVRLGYWYWPNGGIFYGVPLVNFIGWLASGALGAVVILVIIRGRTLPLQTAWSALAIIWFWTVANFWLGQWLPAVIGLALSLGLIRFLRQHDYTR